MFDPEQGAESRKRKARAAEINDDASQHWNGGDKSSSSLRPNGFEAEAVRRRESIENRKLLCRNAPDVKPTQFMRQFNTLMQDKNLCIFEKAVRWCVYAPVAYEMQLVFSSAEMATRALNLSGYVLDGKAFYLERPPEYNGASSSTKGGMLDKLTPHQLRRHYKREKSSRELHVKNVPDGTSQVFLKEFLEGAILERSLNISEDSPITNCKVRDKNCAFLIFRTLEEASAALNLDNIYFSGKYLQFESFRGPRGPLQHGVSSQLADSRGFGETSRSPYQSSYGSCDPEPEWSPRNSSIGPTLAAADNASTDYSYYGPCSSESEGMHPLRSNADTPTGTSDQSHYGPCDPEIEGSPPSLASVDTDDEAPSLTHDENEEVSTRNEYGPSAKQARLTSPKTKVNVAAPQVQEHTLSDAELPTEQPGAELPTEQSGAELTKIQLALDESNKDREDLQIQIQTEVLEKAELRRQLEEMAQHLSESEKANSCLQQEAEQEKHKLDAKEKELLVFRKRWGYLARELDKARRQLEEAQVESDDESDDESSDDVEDLPVIVKYKGSPVKHAAGIRPLLRIKPEPVYQAVYEEEVWDL